MSEITQKEIAELRGLIKKDNTAPYSMECAAVDCDARHECSDKCAETFGQVRMYDKYEHEVVNEYDWYSVLCLIKLRSSAPALLDTIEAQDKEIARLNTEATAKREHQIIHPTIRQALFRYANQINCQFHRSINTGWNGEAASASKKTMDRVVAILKGADDDK